MTDEIRYTERVMLLRQKPLQQLCRDVTELNQFDAHL
jgi:hypothetical protein